MTDPIDRAEISRRVRAHVFETIERMATGDASPGPVGFLSRPVCSRRFQPDHRRSACPECEEITACLRRLAKLPEPRGDALRLLIDRAVARTMAEDLSERGITPTVLAAVWADGMQAGVGPWENGSLPVEEVDRRVAVVLEDLGVGSVEPKSADRYRPVTDAR